MAPPPDAGACSEHSRSKVEEEDEEEVEEEEEEDDVQDYLKATGVGINAVHYLALTAADIFDVGPFGSRSIVAAS